MLLRDNPPLHLTYCLNVHPGETWHENFSAIQEKAIAVRDAVAPSSPFGLGLRLGKKAADQLAPAAVMEFKAFLAENNLYVFTMNGFPYGPFHGKAVKENVYAPDWRQTERLDYTLQLANIMAELLPDNGTGSISTVPGSYKAWITSEKDVEQMTSQLAAVARHLAGIRESTGKVITLGLEPEPDCFIETTCEAIDFLTGRLFAAEAAARKHVGICFDTCHLALQFEDISHSLKALIQQDIPISKIQLSAALKTEVADVSIDALRRFVDTVYFHQTRVRHPDGRVDPHPDLTTELISSLSGSEPAQLRAHFHVPLYFQDADGLQSTADDLSSAFFSAALDAGISQVEIETYTFDVLPPELRAMGVVESVAREFEWVMDRLDPLIGGRAS